MLPGLNTQHLNYYAQLMRIDKPIGTLLLLWPTLWALWIAAKGFPDIINLVVFTFGVFLMRAAGCVINDYADRKVDLLVERTKQRPLTMGKVSEKEALILFAYLIFFAALLLPFVNQLTLQLSLGALFLAILYPFMKRFTYYPQFFLGCAFSWAIPMAFAAQLGEVPWLVWWLYLLTIMWIIAYDTMYAMVDREDDLAIGIKSTAIAFGIWDKWIILVLQVLSLLGLLLLGIYLHLSLIYYLSLLFASALVAYQQWLIKDRIRENCFKAFLNNNWFGAIIFIGLLLSYG